ncbi:DUF2272 domain-containing protein [Fodinicurvata fenggangensis]|uniref:DUF2272 domain-containing protein n=1 Tax=Fodinicurvata fenggangensis TaxID=1121830 RepID=UPI0006908A29|nr:DUF2272 domain-containing protein [Fodinicurvata fenggangensis]
MSTVLKTICSFRSVWLMAVLSLVLAACAGPSQTPEPERYPPISYPYQAKERILSIAYREWLEFRRPVLDQTGQEAEQLRKGYEEGDPEVFPHLQAYWNAVRSEYAGYVRQQRRRHRAGVKTGLWQGEPWSAAFISYVMRSAGIDLDDFEWDAGHRNYVDAAIRSERRYGRDSVFLPHEITDYAPRVGDLVCSDRSLPAEQRIGSLAERVAELGSSRGMHCDIVVQTEPGRIAVIGGNVRDAVTLSYLSVNAQGQLVPWQTEDGPETRTFFAVLQTNIPDPPGGFPVPRGLREAEQLLRQEEGPSVSG